MTKETAQKDWHTADIKCALAKLGLNLADLSRRNGLAPITVGKALQFPYPKGERIIAEAIGVPPETIWPSRYQKRAERKARLQFKPANNKTAMGNTGIRLDGSGK